MLADEPRHLDSKQPVSYGKLTQIGVTDMPANDEAEPLKSRLLVEIFDKRESEGAKAFAKHLRDLVNLDESTREKCVATLREVRQGQTAWEQDRLLDSLAPEDPSKRASVEHSLSALSFLADALLSDKIPADDHQNWADDLAILGWLDPESRPVFDSILDDLTNKHLPELQAQDRQRRAEGGVLPVFQSLGITVEARAVRKDRYKWGMPLEGEGRYTPDIVGTAMIASVHIGVDEGFPKDFYCQMDEGDIDNFIASLIVAKKEMVALRQYLNLDAGGKVVPHA